MQPRPPGHPDETIFAPLVAARIPTDDDVTLELATRRLRSMTPASAERVLALQRMQTPGAMTVDASLELSLEALDDAAETLVMPDAAERLALLRAARVRRRAAFALTGVLALCVGMSAAALVDRALVDQGGASTAGSLSDLVESVTTAATTVQ